MFLLTERQFSLFMFHKSDFVNLIRERSILAVRTKNFLPGGWKPIRNILLFHNGPVQPYNN